MRKVQSLIAEAKARGSLDDIAAIIVQVVSADDAQTATTQQIPVQK